MALNPAVSNDEKTQAVGLAFAHGMQYCLYKTKNPTPSELELRALLKVNTLSGPLTGMTTAMPGFLANENYIIVNLVDHVLANRTHIFGIYGDEDGLFSPLELSMIRNSLQQAGEAPHFKLLVGASHGVFVDQQQ